MNNIDKTFRICLFEEFSFTLDWKIYGGRKLENKNKYLERNELFIRFRERVY